MAPRRSVVDSIADQVVWEHGSTAEFGQPTRAAVVVHWSASPSLSRSFRRLVQELTLNEYSTVVVSACEAPGKLDWGGPAPDGVVVLRKPNVGYDFGSWAVGLELVSAVRHAQYAILANDSVVGPFTGLAPLLQQFEQSPADVWGLTDTYQFVHHLQSYFVGYRGGVLADRPLRTFFSSVRDQRNKWQIIQRNEIALSRLLYGEGYVMRAAFSSNDLVRPGENPVITGWRRLLERGFPFVKREIVRTPEVAPQGELVGRVVAARFDEQIAEWL